MVPLGTVPFGTVLLPNVTFRMVATSGASGLSEGIGHRTYRKKYRLTATIDWAVDC